MRRRSSYPGANHSLTPAFTHKDFKQCYVALRDTLTQACVYSQGTEIISVNVLLRLPQELIPQGLLVAPQLHVLFSVGKD